MVSLKKNQYEQEAWQQDQYICGVDEAGRGCFAGPVVAAAVILPIKNAPDFLQDSKKLSEKQRNNAFLWIQEHCYYGVGIIHHRIIDSINILNATRQAMKKAILVAQSHSKNIQINAILIDAVKVPMEDIEIPISLFSFNYGETYSSSIAAASIVAKVSRDRLMQEIHSSFPLYNFSSHKSYGTPGHRQEINEHGLSIVHRRTYKISEK